MKFELGKKYRHASGEEISIVGTAYTAVYGLILIAEESTSWALKPVSIENTNCIMASKSCNCILKPVSSEDLGDECWKEITNDEWMKNFTD